MEACTVRISTLEVNMEGSWQNELLRAIQKSMAEIDTLAMNRLENQIIKTERENLQESKKMLETVNENLEEFIMSLPSSINIVREAQYQITGHKYVFID